MKRINTMELLLKIFVTTSVFSATYLLLGYFCNIPHLLLFCILGTIILVPIELGIILFSSKKEYGTYSLKSAFVGQEKVAIWKTFVIAFVFFGIAGLLFIFVAPIENNFFAEIRTSILNYLPLGFDWTNYEYLKSFPKPILILTCVYYSFFNVLLAPITEELFFRGYLTSHYEKQSIFTPIFISILFSLYHFWLPFNNVFRILTFTPIIYIGYKKKNFVVCIFFHCLCNLFSVIGFILAVWK